MEWPFEKAKQQGTIAQQASQLVSQFIIYVY